MVTDQFYVVYLPSLHSLYGPVISGMQFVMGSGMIQAGMTDIEQFNTCEHCGEIIDAEALHCIYCGAKIMHTRETVRLND